MDEATIQAILEQYNLLNDQIKEYNDETKNMQKLHRANIKTRKDKIAPLLSEIEKLESQIKEYLLDLNQTSIIHDGHEYNITEISKYRKAKSNEVIELLQTEMNMSEDQINDVMAVINRKISSTAPLLNVMRKYD